MRRPLYALFIQQKQVFHCLTTRLPFDNAVFCVCHNTPDSRPGVNQGNWRKGALSGVPRWFQVWSWARCQAWGCRSSFLLILLLSLACCFPHGDAGCSRNCLPESALTIYMVPLGSLGFSVFSGLSWPLGCHWAQHLGVWSRGQETAVRPTSLPQDRSSRWSPNKLIIENSAPAFEGCCFEGEVNA